MNGQETRGSVSAPAAGGGAAQEGSSNADGMDLEARALLWRCRRGMKELDIVLGRYAAAALAQAGPAERRLLADLLERPDPELAGYFLGGQAPAEPQMAALVTRIATSGMI
ncbi:MAG TPA: succinate dehydrogenase assembly factor 2 [Steroidobacteraceae bacterium]|nr:succinate dehydrogenase assembly factor 2 [Steroidobacteraceae bacterium]